MVDYQSKDDFKIVRKKLEEIKAKKELKALDRIYLKMDALDMGMRNNSGW